MLSFALVQLQTICFVSTDTERNKIAFPVQHDGKLQKRKVMKNIHNVGITHPLKQSTKWTGGLRTFYLQLSIENCPIFCQRTFPRLKTYK